MKPRDYLNEDPKKASRELINYVSDQIMDELKPQLERKADIFLTNVENQLHKQMADYLNTCQKQTDDLQERLLTAEKNRIQEKTELAKHKIEVKKGGELLEVEAKRLARAKKFYYVAGAIWFLALAALFLKIII